LPLHKTHCTD
jgi:hypothetical protein